MKWAFFLLLGLNVAFFGWQQFQEPAPEPRAPKVKASSGGKSIPLLHEVDNGKKTMADVMESGNSKPKKKNDTLKPTPEEDRRPVAAEPPPLSEIEKKVAAVEAKHAERIEASIAARKNEARAERAEPPESEPPPRHEVATAPVNRSCYGAGPFTNKGNAEAAIAKLGSIGFSAELRELESKGKQSWWVLDVTQSERAALKRVDEFRKKNVKDAEVVESGDYQGMVSLGKYTDEDQAAARVNALVKLGFRPVVEKSFDSTLQYWIDYEETDNRKLTATQWKEAMGATGSIIKQERTCK